MRHYECAHENTSYERAKCRARRKRDGLPSEPPAPKKREPPEPYQRFLSKVDKQENGCWIWTGGTDVNGYGRFSAGAAFHFAHRWILAYTLGRELAADEYACHTCDVKSCVNPDHLYAGSAADNARDREDRGRSPRTKKPHKRAPRGLSDYDRFMTHVDTAAGPDACWPWTASLDVFGRGHFHVKGPDGRYRNLMAYRWLMGHLRGVELTREEHVLHSCDNPPCVNSRHLHIGTHAENMADMASKGRARNGAKPQPLKTHCKNGHEFTPENTGSLKGGKRYCRECRRISTHASRARAKEKIGPRKPPWNANKTHCKRGHEYTPENTRIGKTNGQRICVACQRVRYQLKKAGEW